jgi:hypothetical protein
MQSLRDGVQLHSAECALLSLSLPDEHPSQAKFLTAATCMMTCTTACTVHFESMQRTESVTLSVASGSVTTLWAKGPDKLLTPP